MIRSGYKIEESDLQQPENTLGSEYEKMLAEALRQPGVQTVMETMRLVNAQQEALQHLVTASSFRITAGTGSIQAAPDY